MKPVELLLEVKPELDRFVKKFNLAIQEQTNPENYSRKHLASAKRSARDLKNELTKLTQMSSHLYEIREM